MLHFETIKPDTLGLLKQIQNNPCFNETILVGGTALALHIGHRTSIDLDLFGHTELDLLEMIQELKACGVVSARSSGSKIKRFIINNVQVDMVEYDYAWLDNPVFSDGLRLASCRDIAAMKLSAITNRGTKKDFIDLAFLMKKYTLQEMLTYYSEKFTDGSRFMVLKSLVFFDDAEDDPMPNMFVSINWTMVKQQITDAVLSML